MSNQRLSRWLSRDHMDVSLARLGVLLSILALGLWLIVPRPFLLVVPLAGGTGSVVYLVTRRSRRARVDVDDEPVERSTPTLSPAVAGYLPSVVALGLAAIVMATHLAGSRTLPVYALTGAVGVAIFVQVLFVEDDAISPGLVLGQVLVAAVVIRLTALYATPGYVGVDIWTHAPVFVDGIVQQGTIWPLGSSKYLMAPFYHVVGAVGALVTGDVRSGLYLTIGLLVPLSALFVYATATMLVPVRWALLATALFAFADQFIRWGMHVIPTSLGLVFFLAATYAVTRIFSADAERWAVGLLAVVSLAVVFTHQVSTAILLVMLATAAAVSVTAAFAGIGSTQSGDVRTAVALCSVFGVTLVTTLVSWAMTPFGGGGTFLWQEIALLGELLVTDAGFLNLPSRGLGAADSIGGAPTGTLLASVVPYVELFGFALLLLAAVVGGLYMLRWEEPSDLTVAHLLTGATLFVFVFGLPLFGINALLPGRWIAFLFVSMALIAAAGLHHVSLSGSRRVAVALFLLVALGYPTTMVVAEKATLDSPAFDDHHKRFAYTHEEISAVETISDVHPPADSELATDHPYVSLFRRYGGYGYGASMAALGDEGPTETDAVVYREYQSTGPATFERAEGSSLTSLPANTDETVCPPDWNSGYATDGVRLCTRSTVADGGSP